MYSRRFPIATTLMYWWVLVVGTFLVLALVIFIISNLYITTRRLRKEHDFTLSILDTAKALIFVLDKTGKIAQFNKACQRLTGQSFEQVENHTMDELHFFSNVNHFNAANENQVSEKHANFFESFWIASDDSHHHITWSSSTIKDSKGNIQWTIYTGIDITDQIRAERTLSSEKERLAVTLQSISDGIITTDATGDIVLLNRVAEELTGCSQSEAIGKRLETIFLLIQLILM